MFWMKIYDAIALKDKLKSFSLSEENGLICISY